MANEKDLQKIIQVVVFQPGNQPAIFNVLGLPDVARIHAGVTEGIEKVVIEYTNGKRTIFIGMPYTIKTEPEENK
jgi:hypothetical protein